MQISSFSRVPPTVLVSLDNVLVSSRLDYRNSLLIGITNRGDFTQTTDGSKPLSISITPILHSLLAAFEQRFQFKSVGCVLNVLILDFPLCKTRRRLMFV